MQTVVYADVLFVINSVITFLILITTADLSRIQSVKSRYVSGSITGGLLSFIILAPEMHFLIVIIIRLVISILIILVTFRLKNINQFLKCVSGFFVISFVYAGAVYFISESLGSSFAYFNNGYAYFDFSAVSLILITTSVFVCMKLINKKVLSRSKNELIYCVEISNAGRTVKLKGLLDTGNSIRDIYNGRPVIIASLESIRLLLDDNYFCQLERFFAEDDMASLPKGLRLIPIKTLASGKLLPAFTADMAEISDNGVNIVTEKVCIALTDDAIGDGRYSALINDSVFGKV